MSNYQLAGSTACQPPGSFPAFFNGISEDDSFSSFRIGVSTQFKLSDRLKLDAEAAYVPFGTFLGVDNHNARSLIINESASRLTGVQLEAVLSYAVTNNLSIGVGGRYWTWNTRDGNTVFNFIAPPAQFNEPARFNTERYGAFVQASYHWGDVTPAAQQAAIYKAPPLLTSWSGFYIGTHTGGGVGDDRWSDRFGNNFIAGAGAVNRAGFGDTTHASGPLTGGQIGYNFQGGAFVYGVELDGSWADLRGENTCFSGLGGVNCQRVVNALGTLTGRVGYSWDRALLYVKGGGAWTNTTYNINANTNAIALGTGSTKVNTGGFTAGIGIEYAVTSKWSAVVEYDYVNVGSQAVAFPTLAVIGVQPVNIKQNLNIAKVGVNYKLDWATPVVAQY